jgi:hypothetical protein
MTEQQHVQTIIYLITCKETQKQYVGQTKTHKLTRGKWYTYGITQRFTEHIGAARRNRTTPLAKDISIYGSELFDIEELDRCELEEADSYESYYIEEYETLMPNGYNVQRSSRPVGGSYYLNSEIVSSELRGIKMNGELAKVRLLLTLKDKTEKTRIMFGTTHDKYDQSVRDAKIFCESLDTIPVEHNSLLKQEAEWWPYKEKIDAFDNKQISRLRVIPFSKTQVRVSVKTSDMTSWKEEVHITFGSSKIPRSESLKKALTVADEIKKRHDVLYTIDDKLY